MDVSFRNCDFIHHNSTFCHPSKHVQEVTIGAYAYNILGNNHYGSSKSKDLKNEIILFKEKRGKLIHSEKHGRGLYANIQNLELQVHELTDVTRS